MTFFPVGLKPIRCVRCEISRAKLRAFVMFNIGTSIPNIVHELNSRYSGFYLVEVYEHSVEIRRKPNEDTIESVLIARFG